MQIIDLSSVAMDAIMPSNYIIVNMQYDAKHYIPYVNIVYSRTCHVLYITRIDTLLALLRLIHISYVYIYVIYHYI